MLWSKSDAPDESWPRRQFVGKLLTRLDSELLISLIHGGDSGLEALHHRPDIDALRSRLDCVLRIGRLSRSGTRNYIDHHFEIIGAHSTILHDSAVEAVYDLTRKQPVGVNCGRARRGRRVRIWWWEGNIRTIDYLSQTSLDLAAKSSLDTVDAGTITAARKKLP